MICTERLIIQKPTKEDFLRFYEINADAETNRYNPSGEMNYETAEVAFCEILKHWHVNHFGIWKISEQTNPNYAIGFGGLTQKKYGEQTKLNLGFRFDTLVWGKGYATEFAQQAIKYGFDKLGENQIFGLVRPKNISSVNVLKKCNFTLYGTLNDVPHEKDSLIFTIQNNSDNRALTK